MHSMKTGIVIDAPAVQHNYADKARSPGCLERQRQRMVFMHAVLCCHESHARVTTGEAPCFCALALLPNHPVSKASLPSWHVSGITVYSLQVSYLVNILPQQHVTAMRGAGTPEALVPRATASKPLT